LIGPEGEQIGIVPIKEAMAQAEKAELDLVEVAPGAKPPVCKIEDYSKIMYQKKRQMREAKKKQKSVEIKEIKIRPNCDTNDFNIKMNHAIKFLSKGMKIKITMMFRGREKANANERAQIIKERVMTALEGYAVMESKVSRSGANTTNMILGPDKHIDKTIAAKQEEETGDSGSQPEQESTE
jgi:translation initiation factor IF-3